MEIKRRKPYKVDKTIQLNTKMFGGPPPPPLKFDYPISPRENIQLMVDHEVPYWVPSMADIGMTFCPADLDRPGMLVESGYDWFGQYWEFIESVGAQMVRPGSHLMNDPTEWKEKLIFPDLDNIDFSVGAEEEYKRIRQDPDKPIFYVLQNGMWERLIDICPPEKVFVFLLTEPECAAEYFNAMADFKIKVIDKLVKEWVPIDCMISSDDWGTQISTFFSPDTFKDLIFEPTKRIYDFIHAKGMWVDTHSCGKIDTLAPYMVELGSDMWEAQGMNDLDMVKATCPDLNLRVMGDSYFFERKDLTSEEVVDYVHDFVEVLGKDGGLFSFMGSSNPDMFTLANTELFNFSRSFYGKG